METSKIVFANWWGNVGPQTGPIATSRGCFFNNNNYYNNNNNNNNDDERL